MESLEMRLLLSVTPHVSGIDVWNLVDEIPTAPEGAVSYIQPERYQALSINQDLLVDQLAEVPMEFAAEGNVAPLTFSIPAPDGSFDSFEIFETLVMAPELAEDFPEIKTYLGQGVTDGAGITSVRCDSVGISCPGAQPEWIVLH